MHNVPLPLAVALLAVALCASAVEVCDAPVIFETCDAFEHAADAACGCDLCVAELDAWAEARAAEARAHQEAALDAAEDGAPLPFEASWPVEEADAWKAAHEATERELEGWREAMARSGAVTACGRRA